MTTPKTISATEAVKLPVATLTAKALVIVDTNRNWIAEVSNIQSRDGAESIAIRDQIIHALNTQPDLLEALKEALQFLDTRNGNPGYERLKRIARAALKKAKGL